jgi:hypothetical protein
MIGRRSSITLNAGNVESSHANNVFQGVNGSNNEHVSTTSNNCLQPLSVRLELYTRSPVDRKLALERTLVARSVGLPFLM